MLTIHFVVHGTFDSHNVFKARARRFRVEPICDGINDISSIRLGNPFYGINSFTLYLNDHIASVHEIKREKRKYLQPLKSYVKNQLVGVSST